MCNVNYRNSTPIFDNVPILTEIMTLDLVTDILRIIHKNKFATNETASTTMIRCGLTWTKQRMTDG